MENIINKSHFDSLLGGNVEIPQSLFIKPFIRARIDEIEALTQLIETPSNNVLLKHQFPKHMRRRAMSQNVKRIPKRLREHHIDMNDLIYNTRKAWAEFDHKQMNKLVESMPRRLQAVINVKEYPK